MRKTAGTLDIAFRERPANCTLTVWLHRELYRAIASGKLRPGSRLPSTREFARQHGISRGTVVMVFEQLQLEGYLRSGKGGGTWVDDRLPERKASPVLTLPVCTSHLPHPLKGLRFLQPGRPFRLHEPAIDLFPIHEWSRIAGRRLRQISPTLLVTRDPRGFEPLRTAIANYLGSSRGVACTPDQIFVVPGVQQGIDLVARAMLKPRDFVWMEDPGYFGALLVFRNVGAKVIPVPVDDHGMNPTKAKGRAKLAYLTPAHQFPLGVTMSLQRRLQVLAWAREKRCFLLEDDYDSEYRFGSSPVPALHSLDDSGRVILVGSFNKLLFPALRIGYIVAPEPLVDPLLALRFSIDLNSIGLDQVILTDFVEQGNLARHLRRMREVYGTRLAALRDGCSKYLGGALELSRVPAGLFTPAFLRNGLTSRQAEQAALGQGLESMGLHRFALQAERHQGLLLGFGAFEEKLIREAVITLARALLVTDVTSAAEGASAMSAGR